MPFIPASPPQPLWIEQTRAIAVADSANHYLYGGLGSAGLVVVNTAAGTQTAQFAAGVADLVVDDTNGDVYTTDGNSSYVVRTLAGFKYDTSKNAKNYVELPGPSRHLAFDSAMRRLYVAEYGEKVTRIFVVDTTTMSLVGTITTPLNEFGNVSVDPNTHEVYIAQMDAPRDYLVADPHSLQLVRTVPNTEIRGDGSVVLNSKLRHVYRTDFSGKISTYDYAGKRLASTDLGSRLQRCDVDAAGQNLYCWMYHLDLKTYKQSQNRVAVFHDDGNGNLTQTAAHEDEFIGETVDVPNHLLWILKDKGANAVVESYRLP
jgi:hypothetical protein